MSKSAYRAWDIAKERMFYNTDEEEYERMRVTNIGLFHQDSESEQWRLRTENIELMAATGFVDKHGRQIFEGDILSYQDGNYEVIWEKFKFNLRGFYNGAQFIPECAFSSFKPDEAEVVGNKYVQMEIFKDL